MQTTDLPRTREGRSGAERQARYKDKRRRERGEPPPRPGLFDPPHALALEHAARCRDPRCRDVWERAVYVAAGDLGPIRSDSTIAGRLGIREQLAASVRRTLSARGILGPAAPSAPRPPDPRSAREDDREAVARLAAAVKLRSLLESLDAARGGKPPMALPTQKDDAAPAYSYRRPPEPTRRATPEAVARRERAELCRRMVREHKQGTGWRWLARAKALI